MIYEPAEDSYLLEKQVKKYSKHKRVLDIGAGSGIQALAAMNSGAKYVLAADIEDEVYNLVRFGNLNYIIGMFEQHKLIWGDPGMWKDMAKRTKSFTSGRMLSIANAPYFNEWHNRNSNTLSFFSLN